MEDVLERVQDDRELLMELLEIFEEDCCEKRKLLEESIEKNDFEQIREIVHSIRGAAGNISAKAVQATCAQIEQWAEEQNMTSIKEIKGSLDQHFMELAAYIATLKANK